MQVGVAGLGIMGTAIAERLIETGNTVTVWNRSAEKRRPLACFEEASRHGLGATEGAGMSVYWSTRAGKK
jgi:3-hydroxyisobutyrate dehydrogenase-like beta-hydroxyacid dehydrogenase